jgi:hypothetical protein
MKEGKRWLRPHIIILVFLLAPFFTSTKLTSMKSIVAIWTEDGRGKYYQVALLLVAGNIAWIAFFAYLLTSR